MATSIGKLTPLVLAGNQNGITVIPSGTPLTRLNYFDGKFLRAADLKAEQDYLRRLVQLSNQAGGHGVVHGFNVTIGGGGALNVGEGLAIDASGRVILSPAAVSVKFDDLIDKSRNTTAAAAAKPSLDLSAFGDCVTVSQDAGGRVVASGDLFVITVAAAEALCGEEDVYGKLCEEACVTSSDRPYRVEGIILRARPLTLLVPLPTSTAAALDQTHLRSRVAVAFFASERLIVGSLISKAGLASAAWCLGAAGDSGTEVPIGVFARSGTAILFLDAWIARRERMDPPARRYWQWRMAMRPWDAFLAQILQFQCQLRDAATPPGTDSGDPCRDTKSLLAEASQAFDEVTRFYSGAAASLADARVAALPGGLAQLSAMNARLIKAAQLLKQPFQDRLLIRSGIVELPSAAYLPVTPGAAATVNQQVRGLMGEGVDLRFCVVRPDYVPHALEEAQHMERISLLEGLDNPQKKPRVDIYVPDGEIVQQAPASQGTGFQAEVQLAPTATGANSAALHLLGAARPAALDSGGGACYLAAVSQVKQASSFQSFASGISRLGLANDTATVEAFTRLSTAGEPAPQANFSANPALFTRISTLGVAALKFNAARRAATTSLDTTAAVQPPGAFVAVQPAGDQAAAAWLEAGCELNPFQMKPAQRSRFDLRFAASMPSATGSYTDTLVRADFVFQRSVTLPGGGVRVEGTLSGLVRVAQMVNGQAQTPQQRSGSMRALLERTPVAGSGGVKYTLALESTATGTFIGAEALLAGDPLTVTGSVTYRLRVGDNPVTIKVAQASLRENAGVLKAGNEFHTAALSALEVVGASLGEDSFVDTSSNLLFPPPPPASEELLVKATLDWVLFQRRREKKCAEDRAPVATPPRRYNTFHARVPSPQAAELIRKALHAGDDAVLRRLGVQPVDVVEFAPTGAALNTPRADVEADWKAVQPGNTLLYGAVATTGPAAADGTSLALGRLAHLEDALSSLAAPSPNLVSEVIPTIPASLASPGSDGIMVLITTQPEPVKPFTWGAFRPTSTEAENRIRAALKANALDTALNVDQAIPLGPITYAGSSLEVVDNTLQKAVTAWQKLPRAGAVPGVIAAVPKGFALDAGTPPFNQVSNAFVEISKQTDTPAPGLPASVLERFEVDPMRAGFDAVLIFRAAPPATPAPTPPPAPTLRGARAVVMRPLLVAPGNTLASADPAFVFNFAENGALQGSFPGGPLEFLRANRLLITDVQLAPAENADSPAARTRLKSLMEALSALNVLVRGTNNAVLTRSTVVVGLNAEVTKLFTSDNVNAKDLVILVGNQQFV